jgi:hypothetical protein
MSEDEVCGSGPSTNGHSRAIRKEFFATKKSLVRTIEAIFHPMRRFLLRHRIAKRTSLKNKPLYLIQFDADLILFVSMPVEKRTLVWSLVVETRASLEAF